MCAHGKHDGFANEGKMGKEIMARLCIGYSVTCCFCSGEKMGASGVVLEICGRTSEKGRARRTETKYKRASIYV